MAYTPQVWVNDPVGGTPLSAVRLNNMESGIAAAVSLTGDETIADIKTFSSAPVVPDSSFTLAKISATGTRSSVTFLRGDGLFAPIPYPVTSVNARTGAVTGLAEAGTVVTLTGNQTVAGVKTFSSAPQVPTNSWSIADTIGLQSSLNSKYSGSFPPPYIPPSSPVTLTSTGVTQVPLTIVGMSAQTGDLQELKNSSGDSLVRFTNTGLFSVGTNVSSPTEGTFISPASGRIQINMQPFGAPNPGLVIRLTASHTGNFAEFQNSSGSLVSYINTEGRFMGTASNAELLDGIDSNAIHQLNRVGTATQPWPYNSTNITGGSLNRHFSSGFYNGSDLQDRPASADVNWKYLRVEAHAGGTHWQRQWLTEMNGGAIAGQQWTRSCNGGDPNVGGSWTPWVEIGGRNDWIEMSSLLIGGATPYSTGLGSTWTPRYRKINGIVFLAGLVNVPSQGVTIATMPSGYRPSLTEMFSPMTSSNYPRRLDIESNGNIYFGSGASVPNMGWHSISCSYVAES